MAETPPSRFLNFLGNALDVDHELEVLEVGGGSKTYVDAKKAKYTVLDISRHSLKADRHYADRQLLGDAQTYEFGSEEFDVAVFWNVLEHIEDPAKAIANASGTLREGGLVIVRGPEINSLKAIVTRATPHWFHVVFYRRVLGFPKAGMPGHAPFKVIHSSGASRPFLKRMMRELGFQLIYEESYVGDQLSLLRSYSKMAYLIYRGVEHVLRAMTLSRFGTRTTDFVLVFQKERSPEGSGGAGGRAA